MLDGVARDDRVVGAGTSEEALTGERVVVDAVAEGRGIQRELRAELPALLDRGADGVLRGRAGRFIAAARGA